MNLHEATTQLLDILPPQARGRLIHWFEEGYPVDAGFFIQYDGTRCLVGAGMDMSIDSCVSWAWFDILPALGLPARTWLDNLEDKIIDNATSYFDHAVIDEGPDAARAQVIQAIRTWLKEKATVDKPDLVLA